MGQTLGGACDPRLQGSVLCGCCLPLPSPQHHSGPQGPHAQQQVSLGTALLTAPTLTSDGPGAHADSEGVPGDVLQRAARPLVRVIQGMRPALPINHTALSANII